jgi:hypothetical protein
MMVSRAHVMLVLLGHSLAMNNEQEDDENGQQGARRHTHVSSLFSFF